MLGNIEAERVRNGYTKEELAKILGISLKTYYNWIKEETDIPSSALLKMHSLFEVDIEYLLGENAQKQKNELSICLNYKRKQDRWEEKRKVTHV